MKKSPFFRNGLSLDLLKARKKVGNELAKMFGEFRDYNGGLIFKSQESLEKFKKRVSPSLHKHNLLLENFFYSIRPAVLQNIVPDDVMKRAFQSFYEAIKYDYQKSSHFCKTETHKKYFVACVASQRSHFKDTLASFLLPLKIPEINLAISHLKVENITISTYIYRSSKPYRHTSFLQAILEALAKSKRKLQKKLR